ADRRKLDGLRLEVFLDADASPLAAQAAALHATERQRRLTGEGAVDPDGPDAQPTSDADRAGLVGGEDITGQAVLGGVGQADRLVLVTATDDAEYRPEQFLAERRRLVRCGGDEDRRLEERAGRAFAVPPSPSDDLAALGYRPSQLRLEPLDRGTIDQRPHGRVLVAWIADDDATHPG